MAEITLKEWTSAYIKYKDTLHKRIEKIDDSLNNKILILKKDGKKEEHLCEENLEQINPANITEQKISTLNKKKNVDWLIKNWDSLKNTSSTITFVNTKKSEHWAISPKMHHLITDKEALKPGIKTLFESVAEMQ